MLSSLLKAAILGVVEGLTEFLPISSTGHLIIVNQWINFPKPFNDSFDVIIQMGAILAIVLLFWNEYNIFSVRTRKHVLVNYKNIIIAIIPAIVVGALVGNMIQTYLFSVLTVSITLIVGALFLWYAEEHTNANVHAVTGIKPLTALKIGCYQLLSYLPGFSRSASTIGGGMLLGLSRETAAEFSFLLGAPTLLAAGGYEILKSGLSFSGEQWAILAVGTFCAFISAYVVVRPFLAYVRNHSYKPFVIYRIVLGAILLFMYFF
ncbi:undecaprenyl-diphosphate phosphatase [Coprothermobacter platensis]|jgi:undecaprenyl-diphosphatase|uniref:undecaprenyl-diphosphate phosphatase n=1 Tax=Coprothermobacter platensis TaxID=108819 RepID=UPI00036CE128|nr:undecaprenyl-diphosphate phosphatase [Coprothermobacter platensis]